MLLLTICLEFAELVQRAYGHRHVPAGLASLKSKEPSVKGSDDVVVVATGEFRTSISMPWVCISGQALCPLEEDKSAPLRTARETKSRWWRWWKRPVMQLGT